MNKFKGSPGPWSLPHFAIDEHKCNCRFVLSESNLGSVATVNFSTLDSDWRDGDHPPLEVAKYNALLISKAPDMLDMLKSCLSFIEELKNQGIDNWSEEENLRNLIKKSTEL